MNTSIFIYPWDIVDEGIESCLTKILSLGIKSISLMVTYHTGKLLLPHNPVRKVYYHRGGTVYFNPRVERYGKLLPSKGDIYEEYLNGKNGKTDITADIISKTHQLGMKVRAWVVGCHNSRLGELFPEETVQNAFGEHYRHALCPARPEVKLYLSRIIEDLASQYAFDALELESFDYMGFLHGAHHEIMGIGDRTMLEKTLGLCFCDECCKRGKQAGIDMDKLKNDVKKAAERIFKLDVGVQPEEINGYKQYLGMRSAVVSELYSQVRQAADSSSGKVEVYGLLTLKGMDYKFYGYDLNELSKFTDGWVALYPQRPEEVFDFCKEAASSIPARQTLMAGMRLMYPQVACADDISAYLKQYALAGMENINIYNYGMASETSLSLLGAALK